MVKFYINNNGLCETDTWHPNCWISIETPTEKEKKYLLEDLKVPEAFYNDIADIDERPRIEVEEGWTLIMMRIPHRSANPKVPFITIPLGVMYKDDIFITICFYKTALIEDLVIYSNRKNITKQDNINFVLRFLLSSSVWFLKYLKQVNGMIQRAETDLERSIKNEDLQTLFNLEKCLVYFNTSLRSNVHLLTRITSRKKTLPGAEEIIPELLEDLHIETNQAIDTTKIFSDILSGMMDAYASVISNNLNVIMKRLTSISIILMVPTLIASLYGMNVPNYLQDNPYAFWYILVGSIILTILPAIVFWKRRWV